MGNVNMDDAQVAFDESGRPFIILRDQGKTKRLRGIDAVLSSSCVVQVLFHLFALYIAHSLTPDPLQHKANILAAKTVSNILRSSLGRTNNTHVASPQTHPLTTT